MEEAIAAFKIAEAYAQEQLDWYESSAFYKHMLFRTFGVASILIAVLITYFSATLTGPDDTIWRFKKKNLIAGLAAVSAISIGLSSFFDWRGAWESHRTAEFYIKKTLNEARIEELKLRGTSDFNRVFTLAKSLTTDVNDVVSRETLQFFATQPATSSLSE